MAAEIRRRKSAPREYGSSMARPRRERVPCRQVVLGYPRAAFICGGPVPQGGWAVGSPPPVRGSRAAAGAASSFLWPLTTEPLTRALDMCGCLVQGTAPAPAVWDHRPICRGRNAPYIAGTNPRGKEVSATHDPIRQWLHQHFSFEVPQG